MKNKQLIGVSDRYRFYNSSNNWFDFYLAWNFEIQIEITFSRAKIVAQNGFKGIASMKVVGNTTKACVR